MHHCPRSAPCPAADVSGVIQVKCYLSGTPECKFGLNDKLLLDNEAKQKKSNMRRPGSGGPHTARGPHTERPLTKSDMRRQRSGGALMQ